MCSSLHLPAQSGSDSVLERMRRGYTREAYLELVHKVRERIPKVALSSDFIAGFCGETEAEFEETLSLISTVRFSTAFLFAYSMREVRLTFLKLNNLPALFLKKRKRQLIGDLWMMCLLMSKTAEFLKWFKSLGRMRVKSMTRKLVKFS